MDRGHRQAEPGGARGARRLRCEWSDADLEQRAAKTISGSAIMNDDLESRIRTRAYHIWENDPSPDGNAEKHWEEARRQIEAEGGDNPDSAQVPVDQSADRERAGQTATEERLQDVPDTDARADEPTSALARRKR